MLLLELSLFIQLSFRHKSIHSPEKKNVCHDAQSQHGDAQPPFYGTVGIGGVAQVEKIEKGGQQQRLRQGQDQGLQKRGTAVFFVERSSPGAEGGNAEEHGIEAQVDRQDVQEAPWS